MQNLYLSGAIKKQEHTISLIQGASNIAVSTEVVFNENIFSYKGTRPNNKNESQLIQILTIQDVEK